MNIELNDPSLRLYAEHLLKELDADAIARASLDAAEHGALIRATALLHIGGADCSGSCVLENTDHLSPVFYRSAAIGNAILNAWRQHSESMPPYGVLTGVRPFQIAAALLQKGVSQEGTERFLIESLRVAPEKCALLIQTAQKEIALSAKLKQNEFALFVFIPFCPSRCSYCSFISSAAPTHLKLIDPYLQTLHTELEALAEIAEQYALTPSCVYIGGGTPTVLNEAQLETLLEKITGAFALRPGIEFTLEAGRPDTITPGKLRVAKQYGVTRVSVNCQSTDDAVLKAIGRGHTAEEYFRAVAMARDAGFSAINTDIIAGLPNDTPGSFQKTAEDVAALCVENITVHSFCYKKSSFLTSGGKTAPVPERDLREYTNCSNKICILNGYEPYYMYRQKHTLSNLENVGYAKAGHDCLYNMVMMGELQTVFGAGAGAVTKIIQGGESKPITRIYNYKYPHEYINDPRKMTEGKNRLKAYWNRNNGTPRLAIRAERS